MDINKIPIIKDFMRDYNSWNKPIRKYFFFLVCSFAILFLFLMKITTYLNIVDGYIKIANGIYPWLLPLYPYQKYITLITFVLFWLFLWVCVRKRTLDLCEKEGYDITGKIASKEEGIGYRLYHKIASIFGLKKDKILSKEKVNLTNSVDDFLKDNRRKGKCQENQT